MSVSKKDKTILILGAGADMARPLLHMLFVEWQSCTFHLLARNVEAIQDLARLGQSKGHTVYLHHYDLLQPTPLQFSDVNICITYAGWLPDDKKAYQKSMLLNFTGIKEFIDTLIVENQQTLQHILFTGSVAGVRCRPVNQAYGLAKAALHKYALDLQKEWSGKMAITLVIPGFVRTKMIAGMNTPGILTTTPEKLARLYMHWIETPPAVAYSQPVWRLISFGLRLMPEFLVKRMKH